MSIRRILHVTYPPDRADEAARTWKDTCGPLIARQPGCLSEELFRCQDVPTEFLSISDWEDEDSIRNYLASPDYHDVRFHHRRMGGGDVTIRLYVRA
jgi:heme-degrading monooxygenase HmoA